MSVDVVTFGCRLNAVRVGSHPPRGDARAGLRDTVMVNTCAVTAEAVRQARQTIRKLRARTPGRADHRHRLRGADRAADVCGHAGSRSRRSATTRSSAPTAWARTRAAFGARRRTERDPSTTSWRCARPRAHLVDGIRRPHPRLRAGAERLRSPLHILHHPFGRGNSRSVPMGAVVAQVRRLVEQRLSRDRADRRRHHQLWRGLPGAPKLGTLVQADPQARAGTARLRLSSIDSVEADRDLIDAFADEPRLMPHLHLSLQAGDDLILKRMKRRHLRADAIAFCAQVRRLRPDVVFGADIIAGFPTETEDDVRALARSRRGMRADAPARLSVLAAPRHAGGAHAAGRRAEIVKERARRLRENGDAALRRHLDAKSARRGRVLTESRRQRPHRAVHRSAISRRCAGRNCRAAIAGHDGRQCWRLESLPSWARAIRSAVHGRELR